MFAIPVWVKGQSHETKELTKGTYRFVFQRPESIKGPEFDDPKSLTVPGVNKTIVLKRGWNSADRYYVLVEVVENPIPLFFVLLAVTAAGFAVGFALIRVERVVESPVVIGFLGYALYRTFIG